MRQNWEHVVGCHVYVGMQVNVQGLRAPDLVVIVLRILHGDLELIATALAPLLYWRDLHSPHSTAALVQEQQKEIEQRKQELQALLETKQISQETVTVLITQSPESERRFNL